MGIFYPDNNNRQTRVIQLGTDAQTFLYQAQEDYDTFTALMSVTNQKIADAYKAANLQAPPTTSVEIFQDMQVSTESKIVDVSKIIADIAGFFGTVKYLVPGATKALVASGAMAEETAARVLAEFTIPLFDKEVTITVGDIAGSVIGGIVGGVAIAGLDLGIDAIEGSIAKGKLDKAIDQLFPLRAGTRLSQEKAQTLLSSLRAVNTTLDAISGAGLDLTDQVFQNLITKDVNPSVVTADNITPESVASELKAMDEQNNAWTNDDPS